MKPMVSNAEGTFFTKGTPKEVMDQLEWARHNGIRVRVFYGNTDTGRDWGEENDTVGYVGRSSGPKKVTLLVHNARSVGGGAILTHCIVKLIDIRTGHILYQHPKYSCKEYRVTAYSDMPEFAANVIIPAKDTESGKSEVYARCKTVAQAHRLAAFMMGHRNSK